MRAPVVAAAVVVVAATPAYAVFSRSTTASSLTAATVSVAAVGSLVATACPPPPLPTPRVALSFTATPTARATELQVWRAVGAGAFSLRATLPATSTSYTDNVVIGSTTYRYTVRTMVGSWYRETAVVSATTPALCPLS